MKVRKLKGFVFPSLFAIIIVSMIAVVFIAQKQLTEHTFKDDEDFIYTTESIFTNEIPTSNTETTIIKPYTAENVKIEKYFYDYLGEKENQQNSIVLYDETYMQNSGVTYSSENQFDVNSILDGVVINVGEDKMLGKFIEIRHSNDMISTYQSLSETTVKKDDNIKQGQMVGKSGKNNIKPEIENQMHFELSYKGQYVNPEEYFDKKVQDL